MTTRHAASPGTTFIVTIIAAVFASCSDIETERDSDTSSVTVSLTEIPAGVQCLELEALPEGALAPSVKSFSVRGGSSAQISMDGLPPGRITFVGRAYNNRCPAPRSAVATFLSAPTVVNVGPGQIADLSLVLVKPGSVSGTVDWQSGTNQCPSGQILCGAPNGTAPICRNLRSDSNNCRACNNTCAIGQQCIAGECTDGNQSCPIGQFRCTNTNGTLGACSDHRTNNNHCGSCNNACDIGQTCIAGVCTSPNSCPAGQVQCQSTSGVLLPCMSLSSNNNHCGSCNNACDIGQTCIAGVCTSPNSCPAGEMMCTNANGSLNGCTNLQNNQNHCGVCRNACLKSQRCLNGACQ